MITFQDTPLYIGTAGYKFDVWTGTFYPKGTMNEEMIGYYSKKQNIKFLELTFTFYTDPTEEITQNIAENSAHDLDFSVRLPKRFLKKVPSEHDVEQFKEGLSPIYDRTKAFFADFFNGFTPSKGNIEYMLRLKELFGDRPFFVELANRGWYRQKHMEALQDAGISIISCQFPSTSGLAPYAPKSFGNNAYFRLHGLSRKWTSTMEKDLNYRYNQKQLQALLDDISMVSSISRNVFVSFCNSAKGMSATNAIELTRMAKDMDRQ
jgi:uncharacterized protein YecE (DUF72 family)